MAVKLTLVLSGRTLQKHEFEAFERIRIGRNEDCEIRIDNLGVSRHHCEIVRKPGYVQLLDLSSGNGTFVNGSRVTAHNLNNADVISIGKFTLRYESNELSEPEEIHTPAHDYDPEGALTLQMDAASLAKRHRQQMSRNRGYLTFGGRDLVLEKSLFVFGRESDADVTLRGWWCPRVVAILIRDESGFRLVDVSPSGHSVSVNGIHRRDTRLNDNDVVIVRKTRLTFHRGLPVGRVTA